MAESHPDVDIIFVESGGDNLSATFSPDLADATIYVIATDEGDKIPRKGGPGVTRSDLLVINKTDIADLVHANLDIMARDSEKMRNGRPYIFTDLMNDKGVDDVIDWIKKSVLFEDIIIFIFTEVEAFKTYPPSFHFRLLKGHYSRESVNSPPRRKATHA